MMAAELIERPGDVRVFAWVFNRENLDFYLNYVN